MKHTYKALFALIVTFMSLQGRGQVSGPTSVCLGNSITLMGTPAGGTWMSSSPAIATINTTTGVVTGLSAGVVILTYTVPGPTYYTYGVTVNPLPASISGTSTVCPGMSTTLTDVTTGGTWSSSNIAVASVGTSSGVVTGNAAGTTTISYVLSSTGCFTTKTVTVNPLPAPITGSATISCTGTTTLSDATPGGIWSSSAPMVATVSSTTGVVTAVMSGTTTITYTLGTGCFSTTIVTVTSATSPGVISGSSLVCMGSPITLSETATGGIWSTVTGKASISSTGVVTGVSAGMDTVTYTVTGPCGSATATFPITVGTTPTAGSISGTLGVCTGYNTVLSCTPSGGTWTSSNTSVALVTSVTGIVSGIAAGTATISYNVVTGCGSGTATAVVTVNPLPGPITGGGWACVGSTLTLSNTVPGGTWSVTSTAATIGASTGVLTGTSSGVASVTYSTPGGCMTTTVVTINVTPPVAASATAAACGPMYTGAATGASTYTWSPATGVTCSTCATTNLDVSTTTTYTVTGSNGTCSSSATVTVNGNRIDGHIFFSSTAPSVTDCKVWLIQFNPADSSITSTDSTNTCLDSGIPYYEFDGKPAGSYMVKAKLLSSVAGSSGYIPTYGPSTPYWHLASAINHTSATDVQNIMMAYGTVPSGPGFISGYVVSGAGKGTSTDAPVEGMIIYLKKASTGEIITYTYTDATGAYSFNSLGYGSYIVYPEEFDYHTSASATITLNASTPNVTTASFKKYTTSHTIAPYSNTTSIPTCYSGDFRIYPNPASGYVNIYWGAPSTTGIVIIRDLTGREVMNTSIDVANAPESTVNVSNIARGIYFMTISNGTNSHTEKLIFK